MGFVMLAEAAPRRPMAPRIALAAVAPSHFHGLVQPPHARMQPMTCLADHQKTVAEVHIFNVEANQFPAAKPA